MNKPLTDAQLSTLKCSRLIAKLRITQCERMLNSAIEQLLEARRNYANAAYLLTQHEAETSRQQTEANTESTTP